jgi:hypothetical protein
MALTPPLPDVLHNVQKRGQTTRVLHIVQNVVGDSLRAGRAGDPRNLVGVRLLEGLFDEQRLGEGVELVPVLLELLESGDVALFDDPPHLGVDELQRGLRHLGPTEGIHGALVEDRHWADRLGHAPTADHVAGQAGGLHHVRLRPGGDVAVHHFLGGTPSQHPDDLPSEVVGAVGVLVGVG